MPEPIQENPNPTPPNEKLPNGWVWEWRAVPKRWGARSVRKYGKVHSQFWCDVTVCWDDGNTPIPTAVVIAVLRVNGLIP
jgi:hypothetical protein